MTNPGASIKKLNEPTRKMLTVAASLGRVFSIDWLIKLSSLKPSQVIAILDECVQSGWLEREKGGIYSLFKKGIHESTAGYFDFRTKE